MPKLPAHPVVVVTGASAGVGRATAVELARRGARLGLIARGRAGLEAARAEALAAGSPRVELLPADVADADAVEVAADRAEAALGEIDVWINNAMQSVFAYAWDIAPEEFRRVTEVTYLGSVHGTLAALHRMRPRDRGTIVQVGSALAERSIPLQSAYCAAKHAVDGFCASVRTELLAEGSRIRLSRVQLPALNTPQFTWVRTRLPRHPQPVAPIYQPEVAARAIAWAAGHGPRELNVGSSTVLTRLGERVAPGLLDRYLARTGVDGQQTGEPVDLDAWRDNLDAPADEDEDRGAEGPFGDQAKDRSPQLWAGTHKRGLLTGLTAAAVAAGLAVRRR
jgi:NAD(P)-dependent dehydrogenase (short-subunit alcohol dehydrogenase family)